MGWSFPLQHNQLFFFTCSAKLFLKKLQMTTNFYISKGIKTSGFCSPFLQGLHLVQKSYQNPKNWKYISMATRTHLIKNPHFSTMKSNFPFVIFIKKKRWITLTCYRYDLNIHKILQRYLVPSKKSKLAWILLFLFKVKTQFNKFLFQFPIEI